MGGATRWHDGWRDPESMHSQAHSSRPPTRTLADDPNQLGKTESGRLANREGTDVVGVPVRAGYPRCLSLGPRELFTAGDDTPTIKLFDPICVAKDHPCTAGLLERSEELCGPQIFVFGHHGKDIFKQQRRQRQQRQQPPQAGQSIELKARSSMEISTVAVAQKRVPPRSSPFKCPVTQHFGYYCDRR